MRAATTVIGVILVLVGLIWIGQGFGVVKGSFMTGNMMWAWIGIVVAIAGAALAVVGVRRPLRR
jgi:hypothetical protein